VAATVTAGARPAASSASTLSAIVPPVEIMSSTIRHARSRTSPTRCVTAVSVPLSRRLCNTATGAPSRRAYSLAIRTDRSLWQAIAERAAQRRHRRQAVDGGVEEALDLRGVQVDRDDVTDADGLQQVGDHAGHDRLAAAVPLVRAPIAEVGHDGRDVPGAGAAAGVGQGQKLHQALVHRRRGRLDDEHLPPADRLEQPH
jgi:hypothetical protein